MAKGSKKTYKVTEEQMDLICSIINTVIENSAGCENDEWDVDSNGMYYDEDGWGFVCGDDMEDATENEEDVVDSLKWVLNDCFDDNGSDEDSDEED